MSSKKRITPIKTNCFIENKSITGDTLKIIRQVKEPQGIVSEMLLSNLKTGNQ